MITTQDMTEKQWRELLAVMDNCQEMTAREAVFYCLNRGDTHAQAH